jgi:adenosylmethionine-8-amino-7-oxononanoate aminotransferase
MQGNVWPPYFGGNNQHKRINIVKTAGSFIFDDLGNKIFDGLSSWWSVCHGYNNTHIVSQMKKCLETMPHVMFAGITHNYAERLAKQLCDFSFGHFQKTFFCDSGSVAVEVALKMALQYWKTLNKVEKKYILSFSGCYHGETFMASGVSSDEQSFFTEYTKNVVNVKIPENSQDVDDFESFIAKNHKHIACSIIEPLVQGANGLKFYSVEIFHKIFEIIK